jgi:MFS transporter, ACS family, hexuronate transporter
VSEQTIRLGRARAWAVTLVATATMAVSYLDRQVLAVLSPTVREDLGIDREQYGWLASAFSIAYLVCAPLAGRLLERIGVHRGLIFAVLAWSVVAASHSFVPGFGVLFVARLALGATESPSFPGAAASVARVLPPEKRARGLGVLFVGSSLGAMIAPRLATDMMQIFGSWRAAFVGTAAVGLLWIPLWLAVTWPREVRETIDASHEKSAPRVSLLRTLAHPSVLRACALVLALSPMFAFVFLFGAELLEADFDIAQEHVDRYLWAPPLFFDVGAILFGTLASRYAKRHGALTSPLPIVMVALVMALSIAALPLASDPWIAIAICGAAMAGGGGLFAILSAEMITKVGPGLAASAGGITAAAQSLAYIVAGPLIGRGAERFDSFDVVGVSLAIWMLPGAIVWIATRKRLRG